MFNKNINHKNFESDTVHGHSTFLSENNMQAVDYRNPNENAKNICDEYEKRELQQIKENNVKRVEYRDYLLKQMHDKEEKDNQKEIPLTTTFSQEMSNAIEKNSEKTDLDKHQGELLEIEKSLRMKNELYKKNEEKIEEWMKNLELVRHEQENLKKDIVQEEFKLKLKLKSNVMQKQNTSTLDEVDQSKKISHEKNYQCANNRFFGNE